jgi:UDP-N-acetylglucosamine 2-epimerase (non-hydrolysing)
MKIISVVGARPNFIKIAPFIRAIEAFNLENNSKIEHVLAHTGQHYDKNMSDKFFKELSIPMPDVNLGVGSGSHAEQVGHTMIKLEKLLVKENPNWIVVVGDVNATLAGSVTAKKLNIKCCHIEAGLRSKDIRMPEEINRLVTDRLSDLLLTPDRISVENLKSEGVKDHQIRFVGNIMIDTLEANRSKAESLDINRIIYDNLIEEVNDNVEFHEEDFALMTMHRPSNVDEIEILAPIIDFLINEVCLRMNLFWPVHPRTMKQLKRFNLFEKLLNEERMFLLKPLGYHEMMRMNMLAKIMLTDSGGLQEECTVLGTPCLTLRWNTERPVTLKEHGGASVLVGNDVAKIMKEFSETLAESRIPKRPELWDGNTARRCVEEIVNFLV